MDDVLSAFRKLCLDTYRLDPWHNYTAPGLTWDARLKFINVTLDLIIEEDKLLFVEVGLRGGISMISHRYAKANHPDLEDIGYYVKEKPLCQILNLDTNSLYGWAMSQFLPVSGFKWIHSSILKNICVDGIRSLAKSLVSTIHQSKHLKASRRPSSTSLFSKIMENVRKRRIDDIISTSERLKRFVAKLTFKSITPFNDEISAVERVKTFSTID